MFKETNNALLKLNSSKDWPRKFNQKWITIFENVFYYFRWTPKSVLTKQVSSKQEPLCRTLQWGGIGLQQNSLWTNSRPPEEAAHAQWNSCSQHSASVPINTQTLWNVSSAERALWKAAAGTIMVRGKEQMNDICLDEEDLERHLSISDWSQQTQVWEALDWV